MIDTPVSQFSREQELAILYEIASITKQINSMETVFDLALDKASRLLGSEVVLFYLCDPADDQFHARAARGVRLKQVVPVLPFAGNAPDLERHAFTWSAAHDGTCSFDPLGGRYPVQALLSLPIRRNAAALGWLYAARLKRHAFEPHELALYTVLADQVAGTLEMTLAWERNHRQQAALAEANQRLEQLLAEMTRSYQQQEQLLQTIRTLSAPVLEVAAQVLLIPLVGQIDAERSQLIKERMLTAISRQQARVAILDVTGIVVVDAQIAQTLIETTQAARLLGAQVIVCGITPQVAEVIVAQGIDLATTTAQSLYAALALALAAARR